ncbi:LysE family translocator [Aestuariispira ectoiniformans]|uniref:LysE family translocator n=1 Tax=Aestuariispira ectoiniformans TaxID=2775080 RepID=UPI00223BC00F|nr:LysE family translocator [Aestuariispira ectoiniformans]
MGLETWAAFVAAIFVVIMIPGPLSMLMVVSTLRRGMVRSLPAFAGGVTASTALLITSASGLGALILASENLFLALKYAGAAYLIYLAVKTWRAPVEDADGQAGPSPRAGRIALFLQAFTLGVSNPKDILFFVAFLPQFVDPARDLVPQLVVMVATWATVDLICKIIYGLSSKMILPILQTRRSKRIFNRTIAGLFFGAGASAPLV